MLLKFKIFKKSINDFLEGTYTPYNCLCNTHVEEDLIFLPCVATINNAELYDGDILKFLEYDFLNNTVGSTYFGQVTFNEGKQVYMIKEGDEWYGLQDYDFDEVVDNIYKNPTFFERN